MEIAIIGPTSIRLKGKQASLVIDPIAGKAKPQADAVLLLKETTMDYDLVEGCRLVVLGPGEYEVGGVKITGIKSGDSIGYYISMDGIELMVGSVGSLKGKESLRDVDIAVLLAENLVDQSALATVATGAAIFYGPQALDNVKALGKEVSPVNKYVTVKDKLPQEMEVVLLQ